jgi:hypothetical protein
MIEPWDILMKAETFWKEGNDSEVQNAIALALQEAAEDADKMFECGRLLLRMCHHWQLIEILQRSLYTFPRDWRFADLLVDLFFQIGDADRALESYSVAVSRGMPPQSHAIRRVTRVAIWCGRLDKLQAVLGDPTSSEFEAESHAILSQERIAHERFETRRKDESGDAPISAEDILKARVKGDMAYSTYLYTAAATSASIHDRELLRIAYNTHACFSNVSCIEAFMGWRLLQRLPNSSLAKIYAGAYSLLRWGDVHGARALVDKGLENSEFLNFPGAADMALHLATTCSVFGTLPERRIPVISGTLWHALRRKEYSTLAKAFAIRSELRRSADHPVRSKVVLSSKSERPRVAVCVSGQLRSYLASWPTTKAALEGMDVTYFVFTWDKTGAGFGVGDSISRKLPDSVRYKIASTFQTKDFFSTRYPKTFDLLNESSTITTAECMEFFDTPFVEVKDEEKFEARYESYSGLRWDGNLNQPKMYYGIHRAIMMKKKYEDEINMRFDAVIRIRPDLGIQRIGATDIGIASSGNIALCTHLHLNNIGDIFLIMSTEVADIVGNMWPAMEAAKAFAIVPGASGTPAETALFETLCWNGVRLRKVRDSSVLSLNSVVVPPNSLWQMLKSDLSTADRQSLRVLDDVDLSIASAVSDAAGDGLIADMPEFLKRVYT